MRTAPQAGGSRTLCTAPAFSAGASDTDQSLIAVGHSLVVENNFGYSGPAAVEQGATTTPGLERIDVAADGSGCSTAWRSAEIAPSVVPKASLATGLVYTYTKPGGDRTDPWYLTALDFRTGQTRWKFHLGSGLGFNNNYAPVTLGPDGTAYVGVLGGLALARDGSPAPAAGSPPGDSAPSAGGQAPAHRARLALRLRGLGHGACRDATVRARLSGADLATVRSVRYTRARHRALTRRRAPFGAGLRLGRTRHAVRIRATATLAGGGRVVLRRSLRPCRAWPR